MLHPQTRKGDLLIFCFKANAISQQNPFNDFVLLLHFSQHFINMQCIKIYIPNDLDTIKAVTMFTKYLSMLFTAYFQRSSHLHISLVWVQISYSDQTKIFSIKVY